MAEHEQTADRPVLLSEVLEKEYTALGIPIQIHPADFPEFPKDDARRLREVYRQAAEARPLSALCISGGGIRSATFSLGVVQGLAKAGLLSRFDYMSTVSGGGYIGSWLSAWIYRAGNIDKVEPQLATPRNNPEQKPDPIRHLREYNSYLTPRTGLASVDTWTLASIIGRNLLLNWCLMIPLLMLFLMGPRVFVSALQVSPPGTPPPAVLGDFLKWAAAALFCIASVNVFRSLPSVGAVNLSETKFKLYCYAPLLSSVVCFVTWTWWAWEEHDGARLIHPLVLIGYFFGMTAVSWLVYLGVFRIRKGFRAALDQLFGPVTLGVLIFGGATGFAAYVCSYHLLSAPSPDANPAVYATLAPVLFTGAALIGGIIFVGVTSRHLQEDDREWLSRAAAHFLIFTVAWLLLCSVVLLAPPFIFALEGWAKSAFAAIGGLSGLTTAILGRSSRTSSQPKDKENSAAKRREWLVRAAMVTSVLVLLIGLSVASNALVVTIGKISAALSGRTATHIAQWFEHEALIKKTLLVDTLALTALLLLAGATAGRYININRFSLHGMYRNRLVRAYLGASNQDRSEISGFTGFNRTDNIAFDKLRFQKPLHVVNVALNLVSGNRLDWQQRKAESFTFSPFYSGSAHCGFRDSSEYAGGVTLGTAVTVSGAAASPNMGYHSSPLVGLIMMLMNARLGGWYGNTGEAGRRTWRHDGPQSAVSPVIREAAGLTTQDSEYVYLSDGGHFENLGLYEMVMRRCRSIVVIDSGCDADYTYEDLGNALRKVRIDLGVNIDFEPEFIGGLRERKKRCAVATIHYSAAGGGPDGTLLYIKPVITGSESPDVLTYRSSSPTFPHESTGDQWFTEAQTESYRMLGLQTADCITKGLKDTDLESLFTHVKSAYLDIQPKSASAQA